MVSSSIADSWDGHGWKTDARCFAKAVPFCLSVRAHVLRFTIADSGEQLCVAEQPFSPSVRYPVARQDFSAAFLKLRQPGRHNS